MSVVVTILEDQVMERGEDTWLISAEMVRSEQIQSAARLRYPKFLVVDAGTDQRFPPPPYCKFT